MSTIALVDDDEDLRTLMVMRLRRAGYEVRQSGDGIAGLELILGWQPDLVILDWMMPGMTGIEVTRELRREPALSSTPILLATSRNSASDLALAHAAGATSMLIKPFTLAGLLEAVRVLLEPGTTVGEQERSARCS